MHTYIRGIYRKSLSKSARKNAFHTGLVMELRAPGYGLLTRENRVLYAVNPLSLSAQSLNIKEKLHANRWRGEGGEGGGNKY